MNNNSINSFQNQQKRVDVKNKEHQMMNLAVHGAGLSPWEAKILVELVEDVYFSKLDVEQLKTGQIQYHCISAQEGAGKPLKECEMIGVVLTLFDPKDQGNFSCNNKDRSVELRRRRLSRIVDEAKEQKGHLSQEDLAELLMCDVRTIRRDIRALKKMGITTPTRGQQKDIGPGISHRAITIRHWLEGKEPIAIAQQIKHSIKAIDNYLQKFKRVVFLKGKELNNSEIALAVGISSAAAETFGLLYDEFKNAPFFEQRLQEINLIGGQYFEAESEKKSPLLLRGSIENKRRQV